MRARRTPWWSFVLAAALGVLAGMGLAKYGEISGLPLVGAPWIVPVVLAVLGGVVLSLVGSHQYAMMFVAGALLVIGSLCVCAIKNK